MKIGQKLSLSISTKEYNIVHVIVFDTKEEAEEIINLLEALKAMKVKICQNLQKKT